MQIHLELERTPNDLALMAWLAEYRALRAEIQWLIEGGTKYQDFAIALLGVLTTTFAWIIEHGHRFLVPSLQVVPFLFTILGFLYCRQHEEVYVVAAYLNDYVRPHVRSLVHDDAIWGWEDFKGASATHTNTSIVNVFALRSMLFIAPSAGSMIAVMFYSSSHRLLHLSLLKSLPSALLTIWFLCNLLMVATLCIHLFHKGVELPKQLQTAKSKRKH